MRKRGKSLPERISADQTDYGSKAAAVIGAGGIAAIPTETSYGLAVDPFNAEALQRLFQIKQRPLSKPVLVLIDSMSALGRLTSRIPDIYQPIISHYWPGPLTLIFPALSSLPDLLTAQTGTVGVRESSNRIATRICRCAGGTITATSANISGHRSACSADQIIDFFGNRIDIVVDAGELGESPGSSIIGSDQGKLVSIREGVIPFSSICTTAENSGYRVR